MKLVQSLPINTEAFFDFLQREEKSVVKLMASRSSANAEVRNLMEADRGFFVSLSLDKPFSELGVRQGDVIELKNFKLFGVVHAPRDDFSFDAIFERVRDIQEGSRSLVRKADELLLIKLQELALRQFKDTPRRHYSVLRDVVLKGIKLPPLKHWEIDFYDSKLNASQKEAVTKALSLSPENPFCLIHGPPGTGKTRIIAELIAHVAQENQRALLTSHTNIAVDNALETILDKHGDLKNRMIRFGHPGKTLSSVKELLPDNLACGRLEEYNIVGATLSRLSLMVHFGKLSWSNPSFDWIIVDESSMMTVPRVLMGLMLGPRIVLVGDHKQLPPVVTVEANQEVKQSLFEKLISTYPDRSVMLNIQYRSNEKIVKWSSEYIYDGKLETDHSIKDNALEVHPLSKDDFFNILDGAEPVVWVDTKEISKHEWYKYGHGWSLCNEYEAVLIVTIVEKFFELFNRLSNFKIEDLTDQLAIICPYRLQADLLEQCFRKRERLIFEILELGEMLDAKTVDAFQGRERDIVIFNAVTTRPHKALKDFRKLNVAITRAKKKLIIIGSSNLCTSDLPHYRSYYNYVKQQCKVVRGHSVPNTEMNRVKNEREKIISLSEKRKPTAQLRPKKTKQEKFREYVAYLKKKGVSPEEYRRLIMEWAEKH